MKLVIDINDNEYMGIKKYPNNITSYPVTIHIYDAIRNGILLPEHYGDLIDREAIKKRAMFVSGDNVAIEGVEVVTVGMIDNAETIIPATKGDNE